MILLPLYLYYIIRKHLVNNSNKKIGSINQIKNKLKYGIVLGKFQSKYIYWNLLRIIAFECIITLCNLLRFSYFLYNFALIIFLMAILII